MKRKDTVGKEGQGRFYWAADPPPGTAHTACFLRLLHPSVMRDAKDGKGLHFVILNRSISQRSESGHPVVAGTYEGALLCEWVCPPPSSGFFFHSSPGPWRKSINSYSPPLSDGKGCSERFPRGLLPDKKTDLENIAHHHRLSNYGPDPLLKRSSPADLPCFYCYCWHHHGVAVSTGPVEALR